MNRDAQTTQYSGALPSPLRCIVFDWGGTLSPDLYFNVAPPGYPHWRDTIQSRIFSREEIVGPWMAGSLTMTDIARELQSEIALSIPTILHYMEIGCRNLAINRAVWDFAIAQREAGRATVLVTINVEIFDTIVVPDHQLTQLFDIIVNSHNHKTTDKEILWPIAFESVSPEIGYRNSLLIEDSTSNVARFRAHGGIAHRYTDDATFRAQLRSSGWT
jgi:hypothetical protein